MKLTHLAPVAALLLLIGTGCSKDRGTSHGAGTLNIKLEMDDHIDLITHCQHQSDTGSRLIYPRGTARRRDCRKATDHRVQHFTKSDIGRG